MLASVGQRTATETLFGIVAAFIEKRTWSQADLARRLETRPDTIRKRLGELAAAGFKLERDEDHPHVYWSVPKNWFPGALAFHADEVDDLLRLLAQSPRSKRRERVLAALLARLANLGNDAAKRFDASAVQALKIDPEEERTLDLVHDAATQRIALKMRYFTASRRDESWRHASVHQVDVGSRPQFIATCHRTGDLKRFRVSNVSDAKLDRNEPFRAADAGELARFIAESLGGFREAGAPVECVFFVRNPEAAWVARNLPDDRIAHESAPGGARFRVETPAVVHLARYVTGLGDAARAETPELRAAVAALARGALATSG
jgi:predicted DNA-binding transcriptional regulator YafY